MNEIYIDLARGVVMVGSQTPSEALCNEFHRQFGPFPEIYPSEPGGRLTLGRDPATM